MLRLLRFKARCNHPVVTLIVMLLLPVALVPRALAEQPLRIDFAVFAEDRVAPPIRLSNGAVLHSGSGYRLFLKPHQPCFVYIFQFDAEQKLYRLYPNPKYGTTEHQVQAYTDYWIPSRTKWFELDDVTGPETIYVIVTDTRQTDIEALFERYRSQSLSNSRTASAEAVKELTVRIKTMGVRRVRDAAPVQVASSQGQLVALQPQQLQPPKGASSLAHTFVFHHK